MKIIVTGSLGSISKPLTERLVKEGHDVTVISSNVERKKDIEELGAKAAIGNINDVPFLTQTFTGADAVYVMKPTVNLFDPSVDVYRHYSQLTEKYVQAIMASGVKKVVHLSSFGSHSDKGTGMLAMHYYSEQTLNKLPEDISISTLRPVSFYSNILAFIPTIKSQNSIFTNYKTEEKEPWVSPFDIAEVAAEELTQPLGSRKIRYIASDEFTSDELTDAIGTAIGNPDLQWIKIPDEAMLKAFTDLGMSEKSAWAFVDMNIARNNGTLFEDYIQHRPVLGKVKLKDFAGQFAAVFHSAK
ncbi:MAG: NAD-dependent dehydratase [Bacteroidia bacterium 44-10]|nr:MAG: NAD-dependent dehydratase [Bacteroidia bacterium 44-10]